MRAAVTERVGERAAEREPPLRPPGEAPADGLDVLGGYGAALFRQLFGLLEDALEPSNTSNT